MNGNKKSSNMGKKIILLLLEFRLTLATKTLPSAYTWIIVLSSVTFCPHKLAQSVCRQRFTELPLLKFK